MHHVPIPERLYDHATGAPHDRCVVCERRLLDADVPYLVERAVRRVGAYGATDVVFDYALCDPCGETLTEALSAESRARIAGHMREHFDVAARLSLVLEAAVDERAADPDRWLRRCALTGTREDALSSYQIIAQCRGDRLVLSHLPCLLSGEAMDDVAALLSARTKDELGGFVDRHLGPPPELRALLMDRVVLL